MVEDLSSRPHKLRTNFQSLPLKVYRCLRRFGLSVLPEELVKTERKIRKFRKHAIGYLHIDTLYTPKINKKRWHIFICIDRVVKLAFLWITDRKTEEMGTRFLKMVLKFYPYPIHYILIDNGFEFSYSGWSSSGRLQS